MDKLNPHRTIRNQATLPQLLAQNAKTFGDTKTAIREKAYGIWQKYTWNDYYNDVVKTAAGFAALHMKRGDNLCMIVNNSPEWLFCELAAHALGATATIFSRLLSLKSWFFPLTAYIRPS